jgi:RNA polymerase sigma-70 factor, ECF subfamily
MLSKADQYLVDAIQKGDYRAYEMLFLTYYSDLCRLARGFVHSDSVAEDLVSDLFLKIWEQPGLLSVTSSLKAYLQRSVHNSCINYITRTRIRPGIDDPDMLEKLDNLNPHGPEESPYLKLMAEELQDKIADAIRHLPEECSRIFLMSRKLLLTHREIAQQLNISENTVKVQIYRALIKLKEALKDYL